MISPKSNPVIRAKSYIFKFNSSFFEYPMTITLIIRTNIIYP